MLTEQEAKEKWCPQVRRSSVLAETYMGAPTVATAINRGSTKNTNCIGSECMMWRWDQRSKHDGGYPGSPTPKEKWTGYCGLAGKP